MSPFFPGWLLMKSLNSPFLRRHNFESPESPRNGWSNHWVPQELDG